MKSDVKKRLTPAFLAAAKKFKPAGHVETVLKITEEIRSTILMPASKNLDAIKVTQKANEDMRNAEAKNISIQTDRDCEALMERRLREAYPDALLIGEEMFGDLSSAEKHAILNRALAEKNRLVILTDSLDGTRDFKGGGDGFSVMVAIVKNGETVASIVHRCTDHADPAALGHTLTYEKGDCVRINGKKINSLSKRAFSGTAKELRGYAGFEFIKAKHMPANDNSRESQVVPALGTSFDSLSDLWTCSKMYDDIITGKHHFMLVPPPVDMFDYPSGVALIQQAGGTARFLDGKKATFAEMVKRQAFVKDRAFNIMDTMVLAVSDEAFQAVQKAVLDKLPKPDIKAAPKSCVKK